MSFKSIFLFPCFWPAVQQVGTAEGCPSLCYWAVVQFISFLKAKNSQEEDRCKQSCTAQGVVQGLLHRLSPCSAVSVLENKVVTGRRNSSDGIFNYQFGLVDYQFMEVQLGIGAFSQQIIMKKQPVLWLILTSKPFCRGANYDLCADFLCCEIKIKLQTDSTINSKMLS